MPQELEAIFDGTALKLEQPLNLTPGTRVRIIVESVLPKEILVQEVTPHSAITEEQSPSLEQRLAFLKLPMAERRHILKSQAEIMLAHYQQDSEWQELMTGDIIDY